MIVVEVRKADAAAACSSKGSDKPVVETGAVGPDLATASHNAAVRRLYEPTGL